MKRKGKKREKENLYALKKVFLVQRRQINKIIAILNLFVHHQ